MRETVLASAAVVKLLNENFINTWILVEDVKKALRKAEEGKNENDRTFFNQISSLPLLAKSLRICLDAWTFPVTSMVLDISNEELPVVVSTLNANELMEVDVLFDAKHPPEDVAENGLNYEKSELAGKFSPTNDVVDSKLHDSEFHDSTVSNQKRQIDFKSESDSLDTDSETSLHLFYKSLYDRGFESPQQMKYHDFLESALKLIRNSYSMPEKGRDEL